MEACQRDLHVNKGWFEIWGSRPPRFFLFFTDRQLEERMEGEAWNGFEELMDADSWLGGGG